MTSLGERDFAKVTIEEITDYANNCKNSKNVIAHLRSFMIYLVKKKVNNALEKADREMLAALITMREN